MKYIACWSGGKDSAATIILAHLNKEPLDEIIFSEVMFNKDISGELPEHMEFVKEVCIPKFKEWGYETKILHSNKNYMDCFNHVVTKSKVTDRNGKCSGFPMGGKCVINRECKVKPIKDYIKQFEPDIVQYVGIAEDEPERLKRLKGTNRVSILEKYGYTEQMAYNLAEEYGMLSPTYKFSKRGGCWFCPNARYGEKKNLRTNHRKLWNMLLELEERTDTIGKIWDTRENRSVHEDEEMFSWEERQMSIFDFIAE